MLKIWPFQLFQKEKWIEFQREIEKKNKKSIEKQLKEFGMENWKFSLHLITQFALYENHMNH